MGKPITQSKTVIVNGLVLVTAVLTTLINHDLIASNPRLVGYGVAAIGFANVILRLLTDQPIVTG